jgi:hypothetical protein
MPSTPTVRSQDHQSPRSTRTKATLTGSPRVFEKRKSLSSSFCLLDCLDRSRLRLLRLVVPSPVVGAGLPGLTRAERRPSRLVAAAAENRLNIPRATLTRRRRRGPYRSKRQPLQATRAAGYSLSKKYTAILRLQSRVSNRQSSALWQ